MPEPDPAALEVARIRVARWLKENLQPLSPETDVSLEGWLAQSHYNQSRKEQIRKACSQYDGDFRERRKVQIKPFLKSEPYPVANGPLFKAARYIMPRGDEFLGFVAPYFHAIEEEVYKLECFVKHVPVMERPKELEKLRGGGLVWTTDYTSFEGSFVPAVMEAFEMQLYEHMVQLLPEGNRFISILRRVLCQKQYLKNKLIVAEVTGRMSGDSNTALGSSFTNMMMMVLMLDDDHPNVKVEGDDGVGCTRTVPSPAFANALGFKLRIELADDISEALFCHLTYVPGQFLNLAEPSKFIMNFGWTGLAHVSRPKILKALLRAKALSLAVQLPGCPILRSLALYGMRVTEGVMARFEGSVWWLEKMFRGFVNWEELSVNDFSALTDSPITIEARVKYERMFGYTVDEQLELEAYFDGLTEIVPLKHPLFDQHFGDEYSCVWHKFVH